MPSPDPVYDFDNVHSLNVMVNVGVTLVVDTNADTPDPADIPPQATHAWIQIQGAPARVTFDGRTPVAGTTGKVFTGDPATDLTVLIQDYRTMKFVSDDGTTGAIDVEFLSRVG